MNTFPKVIIIPLPIDINPNSRSAVDLKERIEALYRIGPELGFCVKTIDYQDVIYKPLKSTIAKQLQEAKAIWWGGRIAFFKETSSLYNAIQEHLNSLSLDIPIYDDPTHVEETFNLSLFYPILKKSGVSQAKTKFIPLNANEVHLDKEKLRCLLKKKFRWMWFPKDGIFFRTFYGTRKVGGGLHSICLSREDLPNVVCNLIVSLRQNQDIGGIALRNILPIDSYCEPPSHYFFSRELRVFIAWGKPLMWTYNNRDLKELWEKVTPQQLEKLKYSDKQLENICKISETIGRIFKARLLVADFALLENGQVVLLEVNPGHCSGWMHPAAYIGVYAQFIRQMLDLPFIDKNKAIELAKQLSIPLWGLDIVFGFLF